MPVVTLTPRGPILAAPWRRGADQPESDSATCFVSHTVFRYDRWRDLPAIGLAAERTARLWHRQPGTVALLQWFHPGRLLMGDLSVWRDEADLRAFLALPEHHALVANWHGRMHGTHHSWTSTGLDRRQIWDRASGLMEHAEG